MKITKIIFVLVPVVCAMLVTAGPVTDDVTAHKGDPMTDTDLAVSPLMEATAPTPGTSLDQVADSARGEDVIADLGSLIYTGSSVETQSMSENLPPSSTSGITEPASLALLGAGLIGLALLHRR